MMWMTDDCAMGIFVPPLRAAGVCCVWPLCLGPSPFCACALFDFLPFVVLCLMLFVLLSSFVFFLL
jgi:hypothetical protein